MLQKIPSFVPHVAGPLIPRPFLIPSIFLTCLCGSVLPPGKPRAVIITSTAVYLFVQTLNVTSGSNVHDVLQATQGGLLLLHWLDFFILHSPEKEYSRINDSDKPVPQSGWEKLGWAWDLSTSMRGIGWNWKVKNIPDATIFPKWFESPMFLFPIPGIDQLLGNGSAPKSPKPLGGTSLLISCGNSSSQPPTDPQRHLKSSPIPSPDR